MDIFLSYKNDEIGDNFAARLKQSLNEVGFSVYYNEDEHRSGSFPDRLRKEIKECNDFILLLSKKCVEQLETSKTKDWISKELLCAKENGKNIIPVLIGKTEMPDKDLLPNKIKFLTDLDACTLLKRYTVSPFASLLEFIKGKPSKNNPYKNVFSSSEYYNVSKDYNETLKAANNSDICAMYMIGIMNLFGYGRDGNVNIDYDNAYYWLKKVSETENEFSCHAESLIAIMHYFGVIPGEEQSYEKAFELHRAASLDDKLSSREYSYMLSMGAGTEYSFEAAENCYKNIIENGDKVAILGLAQFYMRNGKFNEAAELYKRVSNSMPEADLKLGSLYKKGLIGYPPKRDFFRAAFYFQQAASNQNCASEVLYQLGSMYYMPTDDFPKDFEKAQAYFVQAADMGHKKAAYKAGLTYEYGHGRKDYNLAIKYYRIAADEGLPLAAYHLSLMLQQNGTEQNYQEAYEYAKSAANQGAMEAEFVLGNLLLFGRGCKTDVDKAIMYYKRAFEHGMYPAKIMLDKAITIKNKLKSE